MSHRLQHGLRGVHILPPELDDILGLNRRGTHWYRQDRYPDGKFAQMSQQLDDATVLEALHGQCWIGSRARTDDRGVAIMDRIAIDIDCKGDASIADRNRRYWLVRKAFGDSEPLVYATPSGTGLRVVYRIPQQPLETWIASKSHGRVADCLRAAGLQVKSGAIEIFPQKKLNDRTMLGPDMPLLNAQTLEHKIPFGRTPENWIDYVALALPHVRRWYAAPATAVLDRIREGAARWQSMHPERASHDVLFDDETAGNDGASRRAYKPSGVLERGLSEPGSRFEVEFLAACELVYHAQFDGGSTKEELADALARWLAAKHHGFSKEFNESLRRHRSKDEAIGAWTRRYSMRDSRGRDIFDRAASVVRRGREHMSPVLSDDLFEWIHTLSADFAGARRYRFEAWFVTFLHTVLLYQFKTTRTDEGVAFTFGFAAKRLQRMPFGKGSYTYAGRSQTAYAAYVDHLQAKGVLFTDGLFVSPTMRKPNGALPQRSYPCTYKLMLPLAVRYEQVVPPTPQTPEAFSVALAAHARWIHATGKHYGRATIWGWADGDVPDAAIAADVAPTTVATSSDASLASLPTPRIPRRSKAPPSMHVPGTRGFRIADRSKKTQSSATQTAAMVSVVPDDGT
ncbi:MAG: hypothetical protein K2R93_18870 [Gemmatimonadaceae bacterium]|nr:hypothetical protein [Gemmatimonadaceae bacterium]